MLPTIFFLFFKSARGISLEPQAFFLNCVYLLEQILRVENIPLLCGKTEQTCLVKTKPPPCPQTKQSKANKCRKNSLS